MNRIISTLKAYIKTKENPKALGRWNIDYCKKKMGTKIDLSNEDHCGSCGDYAKATLDTQTQTAIKNKLNTEKQNQLKARLQSKPKVN